MKAFSFVSLGIAASAVLFVSSQAVADVFKTASRLSGFSTDGSHYIYLESSRNYVTEIPKAQLQIINVPTNSCAQNGCIETLYTQESANINIKQSQAEDELLKKSLYLRQVLKLIRLQPGTKLPIIYRSLEPNNIEFVTVAMPNIGQTLQIALYQKYIPSVLNQGESDVDRAAMSLAINYNNRQRSLGHLYNYREGVTKYSIREVRLSPNRRNIVVLIDMTRRTDNGVLQTTLVQGFPI